MGSDTSIQWAHHTFGWRGCSEARFPDGRVHPGCLNCYARDGWGRRFGVKWGPVSEGGTREQPAESTWAQPLSWARAAARVGERRRVFMSLGDPLDADVPREWFDRLMDIIRRTASVPSHEMHQRTDGAGRAGLDWLLLTKRPERWREVPQDVRPLVWLGTSVSDQATADEWVPRLLQSKGFRLRFLSVEPLVGPVDVSPWLVSSDGFVPNAEVGPVHVDDGAVGVDWVIVGGESGPKARPCDVGHVRGVVEQCQAVGVPVFVKQLGAVPVMAEDAWRAAPTRRLLSARNAKRAPEGTVPLAMSDAKGGTLDDFPPELRVRELPEVRHG